jgi:hypothetical protein
MAEIYGITRKAYLVDNTYYLLDVCDKSDRGTKHLVYCGGKDIQCVHINFYTHRSTAELETVTYDTCCKKDGNLNRGDGTIAMTLCAMNYVVHNYSYINNFKLSDYSNRVCNYGVNTNNISMFHFSIAYHNSTFYEGVFKAKLEPPEKYNDYRKMVDLLNNPEIKSQINGIHYFTDYKLELFNNSTTLREFFNRIKARYYRGDKLDTDSLCAMSLEGSWLERLLDEKVFKAGYNDFRDDWYIEATIIEELKLRLKTDYIINWNNLKLDTVNQNPKKSHILTDFSALADKCIAKKEEESKGGGKKQLGVFLKTNDENGNTIEHFLGTPDNFIENRNKFISNNHGISLALISYKFI